MHKCVSLITRPKDAQDRGARRMHVRLVLRSSRIHDWDIKTNYAININTPDARAFLRHTGILSTRVFFLSPSISLFSFCQCKYYEVSGESFSFTAFDRTFAGQVSYSGSTPSDIVTVSSPPGWNSRVPLQRTWLLIPSQGHSKNLLSQLSHRRPLSSIRAIAAFPNILYRLATSKDNKIQRN